MQDEKGRDFLSSFATLWQMEDAGEFQTIGFECAGFFHVFPHLLCFMFSRDAQLMQFVDALARRGLSGQTAWK